MTKINGDHEYLSYFIKLTDTLTINKTFYDTENIDFFKLEAYMRVKQAAISFCSTDNKFFLHVTTDFSTPALHSKIT